MNHATNPSLEELVAAFKARRTEQITLADEQSRLRKESDAKDTQDGCVALAEMRKDVLTIFRPITDLGGVRVGDVEVQSNGDVRFVIASYVIGDTPRSLGGVGVYRHKRGDAWIFYVDGWLCSLYAALFKGTPDPERTANRSEFVLRMCKLVGTLLADADAGKPHSLIFPPVDQATSDRS